MRVTYDPEADASYIYLADSIASGGAVRTVPVEALASEMTISLDFDASNKLIGIEVLNASTVLPPEFLVGHS